MLILITDPAAAERDTAEKEATRDERKDSYAMQQEIQGGGSFSILVGL